ncbi:MAG: fatty acid desaturase [Bdellovibrionaceae bacterium]|nr:fatty acid desaturase [Pseudobdellovibrionaceae bacterium]
MTKTDLGAEREELRKALILLKPYHQLSPKRFFTDLTATGLVAWGSLWAMSVLNMGPVFWLLFLTAYLAFFRGNAFIHEVVHFHKKIPGLGACYNLFFGFPNRIPYYMHEPHRFHHLPNTFGTNRDPEYLFLKGKGMGYFFLPFLAAPLSPLLLTARFGLWPLFSWLTPRTWQNFVYQRASTIVVNPSYVRNEPSEEERKEALWQDLGCASVFLLFIVLGVTGVLSAKFFVLWYVIATLNGVVNIYRARVAHLYDNEEGSLSPMAALRDSVTIEGSFLSELWAPLGLKYHSLHHLAPSIPYHNLAKAHHHLKSHLDRNHPYSQTILPSFREGILQYQRLVRRQRAPREQTNQTNLLS